MMKRIKSEAVYLHSEFNSGGLDHLVALVGLRGRGASALDYLVQSRDGIRLAGEMPQTPSLRPGWITVDVPQTSEDGGRPERTRAFVTVLGEGTLLAVGDDWDRIGDIEEAIATAFLWTTALAALLGVSGGIVLSRAFLRRVDIISRTAEAIIEGDLTRRVPLRGANDDLDKLAATLNHMLDRIAALMTSMRQMSSDVAHDLRTPLSRLAQRLDHAREHASSVGDYRRAVDGASREVEGLMDTFSALLRIAQIEGAAPKSGFRWVDVSDVAETVADAYRPDAELGKRSLSTTITKGIYMHGDQELLTQAIANLVENALRHTPASTRIVVTLSRGVNGMICLSVEDDGPGVSLHDLCHLTDRFYRTDRSRTTPGNGLGLSLVAAVAELHGAELRLENTSPGMRVSFVFK
jgi:signal transduction histidine kinase